MAIMLAQFELFLNWFMIFIRRIFTQDLMMCFLAIDIVIYLFSVVHGLKSR